MTLWQALVWAFRTESVVAAIRAAADDAPYGGGSKTSAAVQALELGYHIPGPTAWEPLRAHEDAVALYHLVCTLHPESAIMVARCAGRGTPPEWEVAFDPLDAKRCYPADLDDTGRPKAIRHPTRHYPYLCRVEYDGLSESDREERRVEARQAYAQFHMATLALYGFMDEQKPSLSRLVVRGLGLPAEPWLSTGPVKQT